MAKRILSILTDEVFVCRTVWNHFEGADKKKRDKEVKREKQKQEQAKRSKKEEAGRGRREKESGRKWIREQRKKNNEEKLNRARGSENRKQ